MSGLRAKETWSVGTGFARGSANAVSRVRSGSRRSVQRLVLREVSRVRSGSAPLPLTPRTLLIDAGIDQDGLLDVACRIAGHYQVRFRDEWLREMRTIGDLIACVITRMFDSLDAAVDGSWECFGPRAVPC
ncbi:MAG: hypothetical protein ACKOCN_03970 [Planctomycetaceae bacterium]